MSELMDNFIDDSELENRKDKIAVVDRGSLSPVVLIGMSVLGLGAALLPVGQAGFGGIAMWIWLLAVVAILGMIVWFPENTKNGLFVKRVAIAASILFFVLFPIGKGNATMTDFGLFVVFSSVIVGANLTQGFAGQVSLAPAAFLGIGSYVSVLLNRGADIEVAGISASLPETPFLLTCLLYTSPSPRDS